MKLEQSIKEEVEDTVMVEERMECDIVEVVVPEPRLAQANHKDKENRYQRKSFHHYRPVENVRVSFEFNFSICVVT